MSRRAAMVFRSKAFLSVSNLIFGARFQMRPEPLV